MFRPTSTLASRFSSTAAVTLASGLGSPTAALAANFPAAPAHRVTSDLWSTATVSPSSQQATAMSLIASPTSAGGVTYSSITSGYSSPTVGLMHRVGSPVAGISGAFETFASPLGPNAEQRRFFAPPIAKKITKIAGADGRSLLHQNGGDGFGGLPTVASGSATKNLHDVSMTDTPSNYESPLEDGRLTEYPPVPPNTPVNGFDHVTNVKSASLMATTNLNGGSDRTSKLITVEDQRDAAQKVWGSLHASPNHLSSVTTGSAGTSRITHNLNYGNARWQASCVEVRPRIRDDDEANLNPVIAKRNKQFGQLMPWEKKAYEQTTKFPKSDKFPEDDSVEIVFYFETHDDDGVGLKGYQNIAARVSAGELPGECANVTAVGGFATWTVPRSEFVALTESKPLLGDMLSDAPLRRNMEDNQNGAGDAGRDEEELRKVTIRMSTASERGKMSQYAEAEAM